jgi:hypothetical protein
MLAEGEVVGRIMKAIAAPEEGVQDWGVDNRQPALAY